MLFALKRRQEQGLFLVATKYHRFITLRVPLKGAEQVGVFARATSLSKRWFFGTHLFFLTKLHIQSFPGNSASLISVSRYERHDTPGSQQRILFHSTREISSAI